MGGAENQGFEAVLQTRQSFLSRLRDWEDDGSWQEFFDNYWRFIYRAALRTGLSDAEAQDVVQETILSVAKRMPGFKYDPESGSFKNWLLLITRRRIGDYLQREQRQKLCAGRTKDENTRRRRACRRTLTALPDPTSSSLDQFWEAEWECNLISAALDRVKVRVSPRQFQIFDCHVVQQWPAAEVARALNVSIGKVYLAKCRISVLLRKEITRLKKQML